MYIYFFDIDGTLLSSGGAGKAAMERALGAVFGASPLALSVPFSGRTDRVIAQDLFSAHGIADTRENWQRFLEAYLCLLPDCLLSFRGSILPGIADLLQCLQARSDVAVGLLTGNAREGARLKLAHYGIDKYFAFGGFGDDHLDRNDVASEALAITMKFLGKEVSLDRVWVIGDTPLDIRCARSIGARAAAVATGFHSLGELQAAEPDLVMEDLSDPAPLLQLCPPI
jgi:phosphoglycolate phosphatase-like HAD superfamily hydrolase